jgi:hypothetical protein
MNLKQISGVAVCAALFLSLAADASAKRTTATRSESSSSSETSSAPRRSRASLDTGLAGKFGFAADSIGGAAATVPGFSVPNAFGVRYWSSDTLGFDGAFVLSNSSATGATNSFGLGGGAVYNWKKPSDDVLIQFLGRASFLSSSSSITVAGSTTTVNSTALTLYVGVGFEAFVPVWPALSLSGGMGLQVSSVGGSGSSTTSLDISQYGSTPMQVGIHYYFD